tara:strand:+ start:272 stop:595 length:324 start_codon:yes stop_codon:yes gene_type:complete
MIIASFEYRGPVEVWGLHGSRSEDRFELSIKVLPSYPSGHGSGGMGLYKRPMFEGVVREGSAVWRGLSIRMGDVLKCDKSIWWMPWRQEAMKDVALCDKLRGGESTL